MHTKTCAEIFRFCYSFNLEVGIDFEQALTSAKDNWARRTRERAQIRLPWKRDQG